MIECKNVLLFFFYCLFAKFLRLGRRGVEQHCQENLKLANAVMIQNLMRPCEWTSKLETWKFESPLKCFRRKHHSKWCWWDLTSPSLGFLPCELLNIELSIYENTMWRLWSNISDNITVALFRSWACVSLFFCQVLQFLLISSSKPPLRSKRELSLCIAYSK